MTLLDRLLSYDLETTRELLAICRELPAEQFDREFDIGHRTLRGTLAHVIGNIKVWTDLLDNPPPQKSFGEAICRVITHDMHHRAAVLHVLRRLGVLALPEGSLMGWDQRSRLAQGADR